MSTPEQIHALDETKDDERTKMIEDALRANLGFTDNADENLARLQQATEFVAAVNAQRTASEEPRGLDGWNRLQTAVVQWLSGGVAHAGGRRRPVPMWLAVGALAAVVGVGVGVGLTLTATQRGSVPPSDATVAVATPSDATNVYRGDGSGKVVAVVDVKVSAALLAASLVSLGCNVATRDVRDTVYVDIDVTPVGCHDALPVIAKLGFAPEANGRLSIRFVPRGR